MVRVLHPPDPVGIARHDFHSRIAARTSNAEFTGILELAGGVGLDSGVEANRRHSANLRFQVYVANLKIRMAVAAIGQEAADVRYVNGRTPPTQA